jgi:valyl-tRNA synthetase
VLQEVESFFWSHFTDTYLELAKLRARSEDPAAATGRGSAVATLRLGLDVLLRLFAPFLPFICEEVWSWAFAAERGQPSIHAAPWPSERDFAEIAEPTAPKLRRRGRVLERDPQRDPTPRSRWGARSGGW